MKAAAPTRAQLQLMLRIRAYEETLAAIASPATPGTCTSVGQEACAVGVVQALDSRDRLLTHHRSAGHLLARGADPVRLMAEVLGREGGYCGGASGSLHVSARELGVVLTSTIVGGSLSMAPGVALAQKMAAAGTTPGGIVAVFFGDGAACQGIFHEAVNLAVTWQLPLLFVCENNQWQAFVHRRETMPNEHITPWVQGHGLECRVEDGNRVERVQAAAAELVSAIRFDGRPRLLELSTYRLRGHFEPDAAAYVDAHELAAWRTKDPIEHVAQALSLPPGELPRQRDAARAEMAAALATARAQAPALAPTGEHHARA
jgi:acetoin:2,6-dichlorophenolindophenol oxidoreductase subunit alpha